MLKRIRHIHLPILMQINEFLFKWILKSLLFHHRPCAQFTTSIKYFRLCADFYFCKVRAKERGTKTEKALNFTIASLII